MIEDKKMSDKKWPTFNELLKRNRELEEEVEDLQDDLKDAKDDVEEYTVCYSCGIDQWYK